MSFLHQSTILHLDLKPDNIFVSNKLEAIVSVMENKSLRTKFAWFCSYDYPHQIGDYVNSIEPPRKQ